MTRVAAHRPLIVGEVDDPHVHVTRAALIARGARPVIVDLDSVMTTGLSISEDRTALRVNGEWLDLARPRGGWLRRMHRATWGLGITTGSVRALELGTWHSAYRWILDGEGVSWITSPRHLRKAEEKLEQWKAARRLGIDYPRTLVTSSPEDVQAEFHSDVIVKPLGSGQFLEDGEVKTVYAERMAPQDPRLGNLGEAPFIVQELVDAQRHLRVVTVGDRAWIAALTVSSADPADWRRTHANHAAFVEAPDAIPSASAGAIGIAKEFALGYSSQDWVQTPEGRTVLLDVNPSGQWLFLPDAIGVGVTEALADRIMAA